MHVGIIEENLPGERMESSNESGDLVPLHPVVTVMLSTKVTSHLVNNSACTTNDSCSQVGCARVRHGSSERGIRHEVSAATRFARVRGWRSGAGTTASAARRDDVNCEKNVRWKVWRNFSGCSFDVSPAILISPSYFCL